MSLVRHVRRLTCLATVAIAVLATAAPVRAQMTLTVTDVNSITGLVATTIIPLNDGGSGDISASGAFGNFSTLSLSISANYDGNTDGNANTGDANVLDISLSQVRNGTAGKDTLTLTVNTQATAGWTIPNANPVTFSETLSVTHLSSSANDSVSFGSTFIGSPPTSLALNNENSVNTFYTEKSAPNPTLPFYMNNVVTVVSAGSDRVNLSASTDATAVPEPSTLGLTLSGGLLMLAGVYARRRRDGK